MSQTRDYSEARRSFLKTACGVTGGLMAGGLPMIGNANPAETKLNLQSPDAMPKIKLGSHSISRLVLGANPVWGYSYQGKLMGKFMVDYYTDDNIVKLFHDAERVGISLFQTNLSERLPLVWNRYRDEGGTMKLLILESTNTAIKNALSLKPIAISHHGGVTDSHWKNGKMQMVKDFVKEVKDAGLLAGVSCHMPVVIDELTQQGWENDFFMACFYVMTRPGDDWKKMYGFAPIHTMFDGSDPERMCSSVRQTPKPCLGFKIMAGGWADPEKAFKFAFENIKPSDGVIVGFLPRFDDQLGQNAQLTIKYGRPA